MFGFSTLSVLFDNILETKFVREIYHSVILSPGPNGKGFKPAAPVKGKMIYVGLDDSKGFSCYCRQIGPLQVDKVELLGSGNNKKYKTIVPHRLVFYNDSEDRSGDDITAKLMSAVVKTPRIRLHMVNNNPMDILKQEVPAGKFHIKSKTFYITIDFYVVLDVQADNCQTEITCEGVLNPYCK